VGKVKSRHRFGQKWRQLCLGVLLAGLLLCTMTPAFCQGCALCYTQAASSGTKRIAALKRGILILVIPPTLGSVGMIFVLYRKRNQVRRGFRDQSTEDW